MFSSFRKFNLGSFAQTSTKFNSFNSATACDFNFISKKFFGKNEKAIKNRLKSVNSIAKITKAMKMVLF